MSGRCTRPVQPKMGKFGYRCNVKKPSYMNIYAYKFMVWPSLANSLNPAKITMWVSQLLLFALFYRTEEGEEDRRKWRRLGDDKEACSSSCAECFVFGCIPCVWHSSPIYPKLSSSIQLLVFFLFLLEKEKSRLFRLMRFPPWLPFLRGKSPIFASLPCDSKSPSCARLLIWSDRRSPISPSQPLNSSPFVSWVVGCSCFRIDSPMVLADPTRAIADRAAFRGETGWSGRCRAIAVDCAGGAERRVCSPSGNVYGFRFERFRLLVCWDG